MKTKKCKYCGEEIAKNAKRCPKCGGKLGMPTIVKIIIIFVIIIVCLVACVNSCSKAVDESFKAYDDQKGTTTFKVGETFESKYIKMKFVSSNLNFKKYDEYATIKDGYKVVQFVFDAERIDDEDDDYYLDYTDFDCYADDKDMDQFYSVEGAGLDTELVLSKGKKGTLAIYCEVPKNSKKVIVEYKHMWGNKKHEFVAG